MKKRLFLDGVLKVVELIKVYFSNVYIVFALTVRNCFQLNCNYEDIVTLGEGGKV